MDITQLNPSTLRKLAELAEKKTTLLEQIGKIDAELTSIASGKSAVSKASAPAPKTGAKRGRKPAAAKEAKPAKAPKAAKAPKTSGKRVKLKEPILELLRQAGENGLAIKEIAGAVGVPNQNVSVWFSSTGKKLPGIKRGDDGRWRMTAPAAQHQQPEA